MHIGIDMLGAQSPHGGAHAQHCSVAGFVKALLARNARDRFTLYFHDRLPITDDWGAAHPSLRVVPIRHEDEEPRNTYEHLVYANPDKLDTFLLTNPLNVVHGLLPPHRPLGPPKMLALLDDLTPALFPEMHLQDPLLAARYYQALQIVARYDLLLCTSQALCDATRRLFALPAHRLCALGMEGESDHDTAACRMIEALARLASPSYTTSAPGKPRIAYFSPLPPQKSGISDYSLSLLAALRHHYRIDVYHDDTYVPDAGLPHGELACYDHRLFERRARALRYDAVLYQMGNSHYHGFVYDRLLTCPGLVTLHDLFLGGFHVWYSQRPGAASDHLEAEVAYERGDCASSPSRQLPPRAATSEALQEWLRLHGLMLNRRILDRALGVVVHSEWNRAQLTAQSPECADRLTVIPQGTTVSRPSRASRLAARLRFDLPADALVVGCFGILHPSKLNAETVTAFARLAAACPSALLIFAGQDYGKGEVQARVAELGLQQRVRFFGYCSAEAFQELICAVDLGVNLRRPPTNGETSAALLRLLGAGVATLVTNVATFAQLPDNVVHKVTYDADFVTALGHALLALALDPPRRERLGAAAQQYIQECHSWDRVAAQYAAFIERCSRQSRTGTLTGRPRHAG